MNAVALGAPENKKTEPAFSGSVFCGSLTMGVAIESPLAELPCGLDDQGRGGFAAEGAAVERKVVTVDMAPLAAGVILVVFGTDLVVALHGFLGAFRGQAVFADGAGDAVGQRRVDEHIQAVGAVAQNIIGAAPDDDAGAFLGQLADDLALQDEEIVRSGQPVVDEHRIGVIAVGGQVEQIIGRDLLFGVSDVIDGKTTLLGGEVDQDLVVESVSQHFGSLFADAASAAAVLATNGDDACCHVNQSLLPLENGFYADCSGRMVRPGIKAPLLIIKYHKYRLFSSVGLKRRRSLL